MSEQSNVVTKPKKSLTIVHGSKAVNKPAITSAIISAITDEQLSEAAKKINALTGNPAAIKELRDRYTGRQPSTLNEIPQDKRAAFIVELCGTKWVMLNEA